MSEWFVCTWTLKGILIKCHGRLLWKLEHLGRVKGKLLEWMKDFLRGRQISTQIREKHSTWHLVTSGVLQVFMFTIFINDIASNISPGSYLNMFTDDSKCRKR